MMDDSIFWCYMSAKLKINIILLTNTIPSRKQPIYDGVYLQIYPTLSLANMHHFEYQTSLQKNVIGKSKCG